MKYLILTSLYYAWVCTYSLIVADNIYLDDNSDNTLVYDNTVVLESDQAFPLKIHRSDNHTIYNNTFYGGFRGNIDMEDYSTQQLFSNDIDTNLFVALNGTFSYWAYSNSNNLISQATMTQNTFAHYVNNSDSLFRYEDVSTGVTRSSFTDWQTFMSYSGNLEETYLLESDLRVDTNPTDADVTIVFSVARKDFYGNLYSAGSVTLGAWESLVTIPQ